MHKLWPKYSMTVNKILCFSQNITKINANDSRNGKKIILMQGELRVVVGGLIGVDGEECRFSEIWGMGDDDQSR